MADRVVEKLPHQNKEQKSIDHPALDRLGHPSLSKEGHL